MNTAQDALTVQLEYLIIKWVKSGSMGQWVIRDSDADPVATLIQIF